MSAHRTADGRWYVKYYLPGQRTRPRKKYFGRGPEAKLSAEQWDLERKKAKRRGWSPPDPDQAAGLTFLALAQHYLNSRPLSLKNGKSIEYFLNAHVVPAFGRKPVTALTMQDLDALDSRLQEQGRSMATRNRYRDYCKGICSWGVRHDRLKFNPFEKYRSEKKREAKAAPPPSEDELRAIWARAAPHLKVALWAIAHLGLRPGPTELFAVRIADVDFDQCGVWVQRSKTHGQRVLQPVLPSFLEGVKSLQAAHTGRTWLIEYRGQPVQQIRRAWAHAKKAAGITRKLPLYSLRHLYATSMLRAGADLKAVSELMGHSSPRMTLEVYYHLLDEQKRQALEKLPQPLALEK
ncbi:MAG: site-specific integrase [Desulforudis sp.]|nr:MAG: site-specific integrase [Desulforudis sp.]